MTEESAFFFYPFFFIQAGQLSVEVCQLILIRRVPTPLSHKQNSNSHCEGTVGSYSWELVLAAFGVVCSTEAVHFHTKGFHSISEKGVQFCIRTGMSEPD